jgi:hypothetical protein
MVAAVAAAGAISTAGFMAAPGAQAASVRPAPQAEPASPHPFIYFVDDDMNNLRLLH